MLLKSVISQIIIVLRFALANVSPFSLNGVFVIFMKLFSGVVKQLLYL